MHWCAGVSLALKVMNLASTCLQTMPSTLLFPVVQWIATVILLCYWIIVMWYLASAGEFDPETRRYVWNDDLQNLMIVHLFGLLWTRAWILAIGQLVVAGACADWFLADDKSAASIGHPVVTSFARTMRYHTGTAAFGSFIIAVVQMIRLAFRYYMWQLSRSVCLLLDAGAGQIPVLTACLSYPCLHAACCCPSRAFLSHFVIH